MTSNTNNNTTAAIPSSKATTSADGMAIIKDVFHVVLSKWYWVVLSVILCLGLGIVHIFRTPKTYQRRASVLVKSEANINADLMQMSEFSRSRGFSIKDHVENEVVIFKTENIVGETVDRLDLDVSYFIKRRLRLDNVYKKSPVTVTFVNAIPEESISMKVRPHGNDGYEVYDLNSSTKGKHGKKIAGKYGQTLQTPVGEIIVNTTPFVHDFAKVKEVIVVKQDFDAVMRRYIGTLSVSPESKMSTIINLSITSPNPQLAEDFLNTLIVVYNEAARQDKVRVALNTEKFIDSRLAVISSELGDVDLEIENFKQNNQIANISTEANAYIQETKEVNTRKVELNNRISVARFLKEYLADSSHKNDLIPSNVGIADGGAESQINQYNGLLLKRQELAATSSTSNPTIESMNIQLEAMRRSIIKTIDNLISSLQIQLRSIESQESRNKNMIADVPAQERIVGSIYRQQKIKEELYLFLLNIREKNALSIESAESNTRLIQEATGLPIPIAPKRGLILLMAFAIGLIIPLVIFYIRILFDDKVRGKKDLDTYTTLPFLGEIPHHKSSKKDPAKTVKGNLSALKKSSMTRAQRTFLVGKSHRSLITEAFTVLRTNLSFMHPDGEPFKVIMISSAIPGSGKSFVSSNLSLSLKASGAKVLLIDADIRKASLSHAIMEQHPYSSMGLTHYLVNRAMQIDDIIVKKGLPGDLHFIPAGSIPPNPVELLMSKRFEDLIAHLRDEYDYIVVDTAPFVNLADARIINRIAEITAIIVRESHLPRPLLVEIEKMYQEKFFNNMALVLNDVGVASSSYGYGYYYSYSYRYSYEYTSDKDKPEKSI